VGLLTALELYQGRDFAAERARWNADMECIVAAVRDIPGVSARLQYPQANGREVPSAIVRIDAAVAGANAHGVINALQAGEAPICVFEKFADSGEIVIFPEALRPGEAATIGQRLRAVLAGARG
jgi:seryl-tRNA(Sec) selenium transferase